MTTFYCLGCNRQIHASRVRQRAGAPFHDAVRLEDVSLRRLRKREKKEPVPVVTFQCGPIVVSGE